ncbi:hypothetical protein BpHYR1_044672 [Brachionus plicatilis]|uniref:Uncharacterized protein n=1 Tax=Brachionus plicatilis TaxID=10195 RepID=A0A3M7T2Q4_BRAPC|nr:hypothetical protein BpHYR1_044672 [Brachionus plicatilis]
MNIFLTTSHAVVTPNFLKYTKYLRPSPFQCSTGNGNQVIFKSPILPPPPLTFIGAAPGLS